MHTPYYHKSKEDPISTLNHEQALALLATPEWTEPDPGPGE